MLSNHKTKLLNIPFYSKGELELVREYSNHTLYGTSGKFSINTWLFNNGFAYALHIYGNIIYPFENKSIPLENKFTGKINEIMYTNIPKSKLSLFFEHYFKSYLESTECVIPLLSEQYAYKKTNFYMLLDIIYDSKKTDTFTTIDEIIKYILELCSKMFTNTHNEFYVTRRILKKKESGPELFTYQIYSPFTITVKDLLLITDSVANSFDSSHIRVGKEHFRKIKETTNHMIHDVNNSNTLLKPETNDMFYIVIPMPYSQQRFHMTNHSDMLYPPQHVTNRNTNINFNRVFNNSFKSLYPNGYPEHVVNSVFKMFAHYSVKSDKVIKCRLDEEDAFKQHEIPSLIEKMSIWTAKPPLKYEHSSSLSNYELKTLFVTRNTLLQKEIGNATRIQIPVSKNVRSDLNYLVNSLYREKEPKSNIKFKIESIFKGKKDVQTVVYFVLEHLVNQPSCLVCSLDKPTHIGVYIMTLYRKQSRLLCLETQQKIMTGSIPSDPVSNSQEIVPESVSKKINIYKRLSKLWSATKKKHSSTHLNNNRDKKHIKYSWQN